MKRRGLPVADLNCTRGNRKHAAPAQFRLEPLKCEIRVHPIPPGEPPIGGDSVLWESRSRPSSQALRGFWQSFIQRRACTCHNTVPTGRPFQKLFHSRSGHSCFLWPHYTDCFRYSWEPPRPPNLPGEESNGFWEERSAASKRASSGRIAVALGCRTLVQFKGAGLDQ